MWSSCSCFHRANTLFIQLYCDHTARLIIMSELSIQGLLVSLNRFKINRMILLGNISHFNQKQYFSSDYRQMVWSNTIDGVQYNYGLCLCHSLICIKVSSLYLLSFISTVCPLIYFWSSHPLIKWKQTYLSFIEHFVLPLEWSIIYKLSDWFKR